jgi:RNA polymerase sigma-70 factor, ECF subfamily
MIPCPYEVDETALVEALQSDLPGAKAAFFRRYGKFVESVIRHVVGFDAERPDILQEVFIGALASIHSLHDPSALRPWLRMVAIQMARRTLRGRARRAWLRYADSAEEEYHDPAFMGVDIEGRVAVRALYTILTDLSAEDRTAFAMRFIDGSKVEEVADACRVSRSTMKRRIARAERRFVTRARRHPELAPWIERASRWQGL